MLMHENDDKAAVVDGYSWRDRHPLSAAINETSTIRHFAIDPSPGIDAEHHRGVPLVRTDNLSIYVRTFREGEGEHAAHAHDDDGAWLVLDGQATFTDRHGATLAVVRTLEGLSVAPGTVYRFTCQGDRTVMVRVAARLVAES